MSVSDNIKSIKGTNWIIENVNDRDVIALEQKFNLPEVIARILVNRGITIDTAEEYLYPTLKQHLPNPMTLKDMEKAANRMADSVIAKEPIGLMGDYDVDGATSTSILKMFLEDIGITVHTFIPEREDGYGPNAKKMTDFKNKGCRLIATLDCGTTAFEPIAFGTNLGLDIIVLDHHDAESKLPNAYAIVNPKRLDEDVNHPCHNMAAVGVVFLFVVALNSVLRHRGFYNNEIKESNLIRFLDLVAFGTVCDVMKLQGVNRLFVKKGLEQLAKSENKGFIALAEKTKIDQKPTAYHLGFIYGPRVNACGRIGHSDLGMKLLSCRDPVQASVLAQQLDDLNLTRRDIETIVLNEAIQQAEQKPEHDAFLFVKGENWHQGVVGIVAGRLKDKYNLPVFALSIENDEIKGSSRSIQGVDLGTLVMNALSKGILSRGGGHPMAAGFSLKREKLDDFYHYLQEQISFEQFQNKNNVLNIDGILDIGGVSIDLLKKLELIAPFGEGNPEPKFLIKNVSIEHYIPLKQEHLALTLKGRGKIRLNAIAFRSIGTEVGDFLTRTKNTYFHVIGTLKLDTWKGKDKIQLQIQDIINQL